MKIFNVEGEFKVLKCDPVKLKDKEGNNTIPGFRLVLTQDFETNYVVFTTKSFVPYAKTGKDEHIIFSSISIYYKDGVEHCYFNI